MLCLLNTYLQREAQRPDLALPEEVSASHRFAGFILCSQTSLVFGGLEPVPPPPRPLEHQSCSKTRPSLLLPPPAASFHSNTPSFPTSILDTAMPMPPPQVPQLHQRLPMCRREQPPPPPSQPPASPTPAASKACLASSTAREAAAALRLAFVFSSSLVSCAFFCVFPSNLANRGGL